MTNENIRIVWDETTKDQWTGLLSRVDNSCYMHAWGYGEAIQQHTPNIPRRGIIYRSVTPIGLVQAVQSKQYFGAIKHTQVVRGPQWIENRATPAEKITAIALMKEFFGSSLGSTFEIVPNLENTPQNRQMMEKLGFKLVQPGLVTNYLDLTQDLKQIQATINKDWVKDLKSAQKREFNVSFSEDFRSLEWILEKYSETMNEGKFKGPSVDFIRCFLVNNEKPLFVARILVIEPYLAGALIVTHGLSSTFFIGWSSAEGLEKKANHLLLWESLERLQRMGIQSIDLGGIDMKNAHGIENLKEALAVQPKLLVGNYS